MILVKRKAKKRVKHSGTAKTNLSTKRQKAIEKAISFWERHAVDMSNFKFDREEANAR
jgi:hypothetical protein